VLKRIVYICFLSAILYTGLKNCALAQTILDDKIPDELVNLDLKEWENLIRRDKFDIILPEVMHLNKVDMWIYIIRESVEDEFGENEFGATSGVFVFTDRGGDRIERAVLGRRFGPRWRDWTRTYTDNLEECGAYDIIEKPIMVRQELASPVIEYDFRFKGLKEFIEARDPERIAVNFMDELGPWPTYVGAEDGISHTDYILLTRELGEKYSERIVSSERLMIDYINRKVPSEIMLIRKNRMEEVENVKRIFSEIIPGETSIREAGITVFRRGKTGVSQRGRSKEFGSDRVERGDIVAAPYQGMFAYVLGEEESEPPEEIQNLWKEYLRIDKILAESIKSGLTARQIMDEYEKKFESEGIILRDDQMHMFTPKNNYPAYIEGFNPKHTHLSIDCHGIKGRKEDKSENYCPRIGSYGPEWSKDIPLAPNHHLVLEYFFYMPCPSDKFEDQYFFWWDHEQALVNEEGVVYLTPPQNELYIIN